MGKSKILKKQFQPNSKMGFETNVKGHFHKGDKAVREGSQNGIDVVTNWVPREAGSETEWQDGH